MYPFHTHMSVTDNKNIHVCVSSSSLNQSERDDIMIIIRVLQQSFICASPDLVVIAVFPFMFYHLSLFLFGKTFVDEKTKMIRTLIGYINS